MAHDSAIPLILLCDVSSRGALNLSGLLSGCRCRELPHVRTLVDAANALAPALVIIGLSPDAADDVLPAVAEITARRVPVVVVASGGTEALAVAVFRAGADDYLSSPVDAHALANCLSRYTVSQPNRLTIIHARGSMPHLVGGSALMRYVAGYLDKVAQRDVTVLITGETGTGKELAASLIHAHSPRRHHSFVPVNCAAVPEALLESELFGHERGAFTGAVGMHQGLLHAANRGTVFLDEIGDMGMTAQAKVLRAIESREVYRVGGTRAVPLDVRVLAATNQDLERAVEDGRFRKDLYFRLNVARIHLTPLRERRSDIAALLNHYVRELNARFRTDVEGFSDEAINALEAYDWPGNVRELKNLVEAIFISPPERQVRMGDIPNAFRERLRRLGNMPAAERRRLVDALLSVNWNKSQAAAKLRWSRMTVYRKMAKYGVTSRASGSARREE